MNAETARADRAAAGPEATRGGVVPLSPGARRFTLVLSGGGSRGFAHVGVLAALEHDGWRPSALVGVSMGAVVAAVYALRDDWRAALEAMDTSGFPRPVAALSRPRRRGVVARAERWWSSLRAGHDLFFDWGIGWRSVPAGAAVLEGLTSGRDLRQAWLPLAVCATDLRSGRRVVLRSGNAAGALYASAALAGVLPPVQSGDWLLADGVYADMAPIDVARELGNPVVIAVDPGQEQRAGEIHNGFQALMRAVEICHLNHAHLRFELADLVLRPVFRRTIDTLDFGARRECVAAGMRAVRGARGPLRRLLGDAPSNRGRGAAAPPSLAIAFEPGLGGSAAGRATGRKTA